MAGQPDRFAGGRLVYCRVETEGLMKYAEYIMEILRVQRGLSVNDTSLDKEIEEELSQGDKMSKSSDVEIDKERFWGR